MTQSDQGSSPCFAHELVLSRNGYETVDEQTEIDVARWRRGERQRLIEARLAITAKDRAKIAMEVCKSLQKIIDPASRPVVGVYWPFRGELDLRDWMKELSNSGARIVLPVVAAKGQPLVFRVWHPGCRMERGVWNIPVPADDRRIEPEFVISPVVGVDRAGYRLGYGGGFYDRTLASMKHRPHVIGVGHPVAEIDTIFPLPHDIPMDQVLLGTTEWNRQV